MERKSGSSTSSRSPSLSRRPSLKDKKPVVISKPKKKPSAGLKKERWLLTRKTWRYMSDAVGNLLPSDYRTPTGRTSRRPSAPPDTSSSPSTSSPPAQQPLSLYTISQSPLRPSTQPTSSVLWNQRGFEGLTARRSSNCTDPSLEQIRDVFGTSRPQSSFDQRIPTLHQHQQFRQDSEQRLQFHPQPHHHQQQQKQQQQQQQLEKEHSHTRLPQYQGQEEYRKYNKKTVEQEEEEFYSRSSSVGFQSSRAGPCLGRVGGSSGTTASGFLWTSFPSHRPGVTPTGPGPGCPHHPPSSQMPCEEEPFLQPALDVRAMEAEFHDVCNKQSKYLLWTKTPAKGLSGPSLRQMKMNMGAGFKEEEMVPKLHRPEFPQQFTTSTEKADFYSDYYSPEEESFGDEDDYDEYEDEDVVTVREGRRGSSTTSQPPVRPPPATPALRPFFSPLSSPLTGSETSYVMIVTGSGVQKIVRNMGMQTEPFPEDLLIRLRLQAVHEDRMEREKKKEGGGESDTSVLPIGGPCMGDQERSNKDWSGEGVKEEGIEVKAKHLDTTTDQTDKKSEESGYSSSISDTVMKYLSNLRMVRKNSKADKDKEAIDKFKTVNYDRSLRYIKSKNVTVEEALEHEKNKALGLGHLNQSGAASVVPSDPPPSPVVQAVPRKAAGGTGKAFRKSSGSGTSGSNAAVGAGKPKSTSRFPSSKKVSIAQTADPEPSESSRPSPSERAPKSVTTTETTPTSFQTSQATEKSSLSNLDKSLKGAECDSSTITVGPIGLTVQVGSTNQMTDVKNGGAVSSALGVVSTASLVDSPGVMSASVGSVGAVASIFPSVGIQAGESLIRFLKNLSGRKFSDFSSTTSYCSSESPVEVTSPRYSIATTVMSSGSEGDAYLQHAAALATLMTTGKYFKSGGGESFPSTTTARSSFDMFSVADSSEYDDVFNSYQLIQTSAQFTQPPQQHQQNLILEQSMGAFSTVEVQSGMMKKSPSTTSVPGLSTYSYSQRTAQIPSPYSSRHEKYQSPSDHDPHQEGQSEIRSSSGQKMASSSTPSTPVPTTSSSSGLMKSFFSSSPFSSTFGSKVGLGFKKPMSSTSLVTSSLSSTSLLTSSVSPPPTTTSSPNLLSLIHSSASSFVGGSRGSPSASKYQPPRGEAGGTTFTSIPSPSSSSSLVSSLDHVISKYGSSRPRRPSSSSSAVPTGPPFQVMQKSKSSSSVGPGYGGPGDSCPPLTSPTAPNKLISKSRIFKSRSKSSTRGSGSSGSVTSPPCSWAPQGKCKWRSGGGKTITLEPTTVLSLTEVERQTLQEVALEKLKTLSLGVDIKIPKDKCGVGKPKRRPYLLKKKALSTGFFESGTKREEGKETGGGGIVFGVSLSQCVANDRLKAAFKSPEVPSIYHHHQHPQKEDKGSTESLYIAKRPSNVGLETTPQDLRTVGAETAVAMSVPALVTACIRHLETYGLHTTGIFRVSTSLKRIRQLREEIDGGKKEIGFGEEHSPHDVAALLKEFLRDLPEPLLSRELYQAFLKTQRIRNRKQQLEATQHLVQLLPVPNRDTLASLLNFFAKVVANAAETRSSSGELLAGNKMEGYSLATLIAPNILPCMPTEGHLTSTDQNLTKERRDSIDVVNYMISNYKELFQVTPDLLHDVYLHLMDTQPEVVEDILKLKSGLIDDGMEEETSSVFEGSECGETVDESRIFRRREDLLHQEAGKSSSAAQGTRTEGRRERTGGRKEGGGHGSIGGASIGGDEARPGRKERGGTGTDAERAQSGGESDTSSTKSTSRWFRRTRADTKTRTSSDSGGEKIKGKDDRCLEESKRASSLDSVNIVGERRRRDEKSAEDGSQSLSQTSLKVPENYARRQSSPVLETGGVITASLKIPVPLNIDDTDIPFIEDEQQEGLGNHPSVHHQIRQSKPRPRSASTDSSAQAKSPGSSITATPISSPLRQPSSESSSPGGFSPPGSPPFDPRTFPYEEMTARILIGTPTGSSTGLQSHHSSLPLSNLSTVTTSVSTSSESKSAGSTPTIRPKLSKKGQSPTGSIGPVSSTTAPESKGRETNIGGLIKSKTADFEKLVKSRTTRPVSSTSTTTSATPTYPIGPKLRLRSQDNIVLKQQYLLRQQLQQEEDAKEESGRLQTPSDKQQTPKETTKKTEEKRPLTRRRQLTGSASSSGILGSVGSDRGSAVPPPATSSRWKRSEIIASGGGAVVVEGTKEPETFV